MFCRVEIDRPRKRITLFADPERSADYSRYPIVVRMETSPDRKNATFSPSVHLTNIDVQQALRISEMYSWLESGDFHRFVLELDHSDSLPPGADGFALEALGSDVKTGGIEFALRDEFREVLSQLANLQDQVGQRIPFPLRLTPQQKEAVENLSDAAVTGMSAAKAYEDLKVIGRLSSSVWTTVRISTYFPNGQIESDQFLGPFPRLIPHAELDNTEHQQELNRTIVEGSIPVFLAQNSQFDVMTLKERIVEGVSQSGRKSFIPSEPEFDTLPQSYYQVTIHPIQDKIWYEEQVIHYQVRDISEISRIIARSVELLRQDMVGEATQELMEGLARFPNEAYLLGLLGWAYYWADDIDAAYKYSLDAVNQHGEPWLRVAHFALYNLGLCSLLLGRVDESISWYEKAVAAGRDQVLDESIEDLEAVAEAALPETLYALAFLYEHKADSRRAIELYREFLDSDSQCQGLRDSAEHAILLLKQD